MKWGNYLLVAVVLFLGQAAIIGLLYVINKKKESLVAPVFMLILCCLVSGCVYFGNLLR